MSKKHNLPTFQTLANESDDWGKHLGDLNPIKGVILSVAYLDQMVLLRLSQFMIEGETTQSLLNDLDGEGALQPLGARSAAAYCLGLIPKWVYNNLRKFASIRNQFAHVHTALTFDSPSVAKYLDKLWFPARYEIPPIGDGARAGKFDFGVDSTTIDDRRDKYIRAYGATFNVLAFLSTEARPFVDIKPYHDRRPRFPGDD